MPEREFALRPRGNVTFYVTTAVTTPSVNNLMNESAVRSFHRHGSLNKAHRYSEAWPVRVRDSVPAFCHTEREQAVTMDGHGS